MKKSSLRSAKGFTLIELAVVIAIIAILAAVAIPRFGNTTASAECSTIKDMVSNLNSAMSIYTAENAGTPAGFTDFVTTGDLSAATTATAAGRYSISVKNFGSQVTATAGTCAVAADKITCPNAFKMYSPEYNILNGSITLKKPVDPKNNNSLVCQ